MGPTNASASGAASGSSPPSSGPPTAAVGIGRRHAASVKAKVATAVEPSADYQIPDQVGPVPALLIYHAIRVVVCFALDGVQRDVPAFNGDGSSQHDWDAAETVFKAWSMVVGLQNVKDKRLCLSVRIEEEVTSG
jgi:hypothetical protein